MHNHTVVPSDTGAEVIHSDPGLFLCGKTISWVGWGEIETQRKGLLFLFPPPYSGAEALAMLCPGLFSPSSEHILSSSPERIRAELQYARKDDYNHRDLLYPVQAVWMLLFVLLHPQSGQTFATNCILKDIKTCSQTLQQGRCFGVLWRSPYSVQQPATPIHINHQINKVLKELWGWILRIEIPVITIIFGQNRLPSLFKNTCRDPGFRHPCVWVFHTFIHMFMYWWLLQYVPCLGKLWQKKQLNSEPHNRSSK